jgi:hypothetical protein
MVGSGESSISGLLGTLAAKYGKELSADKPVTKPQP